METYIFWISIGILALFLVVGLLTGLYRGVKRSALHILFFVLSVIVSIFVTKPITNALLGITITVSGEKVTISQYIIKLIQDSFDISSFSTATEFLTKIPMAIVAPILFLFSTLVLYFVFDIIYMIVAKVSFGSKKKEFKQHKPYRAYGAIIGMVEGLLALFVMFAPITSLTKTYQQIVQLSPAYAQVLSEDKNSEKMKTVAESISEMLPKEVNEAIFAFNDSAVGKISGVGGFNNVLFDYLSSFEVDGQKINFRTEIVSITSTYDEFVDIYNMTVDGDYTSIDMTKFKSKLEKVLDNGIFKKVISDTLNDVIVKFSEVKENLQLDELPELVQDIINDLQTKFSEEGFNTYEYLKSDILKVVDIFTEIFDKDLITKFGEVEDSSLVEMLELVNENKDAVSNVVGDVFSLNLFKDAFNSLGKYCSTIIEEIFAEVNTEELEIKLNVDIQDKDEMVNDILTIIDEFLEINETVDFTEIMYTENIIEYLTSFNNIGEILSQIGDILDQIRELDILVLPEEEGLEQKKTYVFDNILSIMGFDILGDEVYLTPNNPTTKVKLDTYSLFFDYLKNPIEKANDLGLTDLGGSTTFDSIIDSLLIELQKPNGENVLAEILVPFYQLKAFDLNNLIFNNVVDMLSDSNNTSGLINFTNVKVEANADTTYGGVKIWYDELTQIGKTLNSLNIGEVDVSGQNLTYLKAILSGEVEIESVLKEMINASHFESVMTNIFDTKSFADLVEIIFTEIDSSVGNITGVTPTTDLTKLSSTKSETISVLNTMLQVTLNNSELTLENIGQILDILKTNAYNGGTKDGVLNEIFANMIWYMTGDDITGKDKFEGYHPNASAVDLKAYLEVSSTDNFAGYYTIGYEESILELQDVIGFSTNLTDALDGMTLSQETIATYVSKFKEVLDDMDKDEEEKVEIINNLKKLIDNNSERDDILTEEEKTEFGDGIITAIDHTDSGISAELGTALKNLLGISA